MPRSGKRAGPGKPRLDPDDESVYFTIMVPSAWRERFHAAAKAAGYKRTAEWARDVLEAAVKRLKI